MITQQQLKELFTYDETSGNFIRNITTSSSAIKGKVAGSIDESNGYHYISINRVKYPTHRLIFLYMQGKYPPLVDHIDGNPANNSWSNLRECLQVENRYNSRKMKNNTSGYKGISFYGGRFEHYRASIVIPSKERIRRTFSTLKYSTRENALKAAISWIQEMRELHHGYFHNHG